MVRSRLLAFETRRRLRWHAFFILTIGRARMPLPTQYSAHLAKRSKSMPQPEGNDSMHEFRFGMEEEYFVVDRQSGSLKSSLPKQFMRLAKRKLGPSVMYELLQ